MFLCSGCGRAFNEEDGYAHLADCPNTTGTGAQLIRIDEMEEPKKKEEKPPKKEEPIEEPKKEEEPPKEITYEPKGNLFLSLLQF